MRTGGGGDEAPIYTDGAAPRTLWTTCAITAVFAPGVDVPSVAAAAAAAAGVDPPPVWSAPTTAPAAEWEAALRGAFEPMCAAPGVWVVPVGDAVPAAAEGATIVRLTPGLAFGTGAHATTALCVAWLARHADALAAARLVVDYGSGSGILAAAAALLGGRRVVATDCEPQAVSATVDTAAANGVSTSVVAIAVDPTPGCLPPELPVGGADVLVANVLAGPLTELAPLLASAAAPGALIALSGVLETQAGGVIAAYGVVGVRLTVDEVREGWVLLSRVKEG